MIYKREELTKIKFIDTRNAMQRYMGKFIKNRKEINNLKWHEKNFFYEHIQIIKNNEGKNIFDIYSIPEAKDYVLYKLILIYQNNKFNFDKKVFDYNHEIDKIERARHKRIFFKLLGEWTKELENGKGQYLMEIKPLYEKKLKN